MPEINFYISRTDLDRLFAIKKLQGKDDLTGNDLAREILESYLYRHFPATPDFDENGNVVNADRYGP